MAKTNHNHSCCRLQCHLFQHIIGTVNCSRPLLPNDSHSPQANTNLWACNKPASSSSQMCIILAVNTCHLLKCCKRTSTLVTHHEIHTNMTSNVQGITGKPHYSKVCNVRSIMNVPIVVSCYVKPNKPKNGLLLQPWGENRGSITMDQWNL